MNSRNPLINKSLFLNTFSENVDDNEETAETKPSRPNKDQHKTKEIHLKKGKSRNNSDIISTNENYRLQSVKNMKFKSRNEN